MAIFQELLKKVPTTSVIYPSAEFCVGVMTKYGKGVKKDEAKGEKILRQSYNNGYFYASEFLPKQKILTMPVVYEIRQLRPNTCYNVFYQLGGLGVQKR